MHANSLTRKEDIYDQHQPNLSPLRQDGDPPSIRVSQIEFAQGDRTNEPSETKREGVGEQECSSDPGRRELGDVRRYRGLKRP